MKTFIILCCFVAITIATPTTTTTFELLSKWNQFKSTHGKNYENPTEEKKRIEIFANNVRKIEEHNKLYEQGLSKYKMAVNQFADWSHDEFAEYLTKQKRVQTEALFTFQQPLNANLPKAVDWRKHGAVTPVKVQGDCGSCWAFSTTGSLEGQMAIKKGKLVSLSEQELVDCVTKNIGCNGGAIDTAFIYVKNHGLTTEQEYPYEAIDHHQCFRGNKSEVVRTRGYVNIPTWNEPSLLSAVATVGPISAGVDSISWTFYNEGIFDSNCFRDIKLLNHGVLVVGYGTDEKGEDYWIVKNSWGSGWGENGYIRLPRNQNTCGIATEASYPLLA